MDQGTHRLLFVLGGTVTLSLGLLVACSDNGSFSQLPTATNNTVDSGRGSSDDDDDDDQDQDDEETDGGGKDGGGDGGLCSKASYPKSVSDIFCFKGEDGQNLYCKPKNDAGVPQVCCGDAQNAQGTFAMVNYCADLGTACKYQTGYGPGNVYQCLEQRHCGTGQQCCLIAGTAGALDAQPDGLYGSCGMYYAKPDYKQERVKGTTCKASCTGTDIQLCAEDSDCPTGKTCHYLKLNGRNSGICK